MAREGLPPDVARLVHVVVSAAVAGLTGWLLLRSFPSMPRMEEEGLALAEVEKEAARRLLKPRSDYRARRRRRERAMRVQQKERRKMEGQDEEEDMEDHKKKRKWEWEPEQEPLLLNSYERLAAQNAVSPEQISTSFANVGGLEAQVEELRESVIYSLLYPELFAQSKALAAPRGVLLHGPPGVGKTMLAKALAKEAGATFLNITPSFVMDKYFGESQKRVRAVFSFAKKVAPTVVFLDEIDCLLGHRDDSSGVSASRTFGSALDPVKSEFLLCWDGLLSDSASSLGADEHPTGDGTSSAKPAPASASATTRENSDLADSAPVIVLGATNRAGELDAAIARRLPKKIGVPLPGQEGRRAILEIMLSDELLADSLDIGGIAERCEFFSGSQLAELVRTAAMYPVREALRELGDVEGNGDAAPLLQRRPLEMRDFEEALAVLTQGATLS